MIDGLYVNKYGGPWTEKGYRFLKYYVNIKFCEIVTEASTSVISTLGKYAWASSLLHNSVVMYLCLCSKTLSPVQSFTGHLVQVKETS